MILFDLKIDLLFKQSQNSQTFSINIKPEIHLSVLLWATTQLSGKDPILRLHLMSGSAQ